MKTKRVKMVSAVVLETAMMGSLIALPVTLQSQIAGAVTIAIVGALLLYGWYAAPSAEMTTVDLRDPDYVSSMVEQMQAMGMDDEEIAEILNEIHDDLEGKQ